MGGYGSGQNLHGRYYGYTVEDCLKFDNENKAKT